MATQTKTQQTTRRDDVFGVLLHVATKQVKNNTTHYGYLVRPFSKGQKAVFYNAATQTEKGNEYLSSFKPGQRVGLTLKKNSNFANDIEKIHPVYSKKSSK